MTYHVIGTITGPIIIDDICHPDSCSPNEIKIRDERIKSYIEHFSSRLNKSVIVSGTVKVNEME